MVFNQGLWQKRLSQRNFLSSKAVLPHSVDCNALNFLRNCVGYWILVVVTVTSKMELQWLHETARSNYASCLIWSTLEIFCGKFGSKSCQSYKKVLLVNWQKIIFRLNLKSGKIRSQLAFGYIIVWQFNPYFYFFSIIVN